MLLKNNNQFRNKIFTQNKELFDLAKKVKADSFLFLENFEARNVKLDDLAPYQRIFLFFLTKAIKTYSAICILCQEGYGQDACVLLRSLLESLISVKYMLLDLDSADEKALRFVEYKWVILKRYLSETKNGLENEQKDDLYSKKKLIIDKFNEYKRKYNIVSDRALLSWSGKTIKDMARITDKNLFREYESAFRIYSRFSHASIIGDNEYMDFKNNILTFSPSPGTIAVTSALKNAINYTMDFLRVFNDMFNLHYETRIRKLECNITEVFNMDKYKEIPAIEKSYTKEEFKKMLVKFDISL